MSEKLTAARKLTLVRERQAALVAEAKAAVARAEAELARAKDHLAKIELETPCLLRLAEIRVEAAAVKRQLRQLRGEAGPKAGNTNEGAPEAAGTVETADGQTRELTKAAALVVRAAVGRRKSGLLAPLDGEVAQGLLSAIDQGGGVGDSFVVRLAGRRGALRFEVVAEGLRFRHVSS